MPYFCCSNVLNAEVVYAHAVPYRLHQWRSCYVCSSTDCRHTGADKLQVGHVQHLSFFIGNGTSVEVWICHCKSLPNTGLAICSVLRGMDDFWSFFDQCLQSVPPHLGASADRLFVEELASPSRIALGAPDGEDAVYDAHAALRSLAGLLNAVGDVANLDDLEGFPELSSCMSELTCMCE